MYVCMHISPTVTQEVRSMHGGWTRGKVMIGGCLKLWYQGVQSICSESDLIRCCDMGLTLSNGVNEFNQCDSVHQYISMKALDQHTRYFLKNNRPTLTYLIDTSAVL